MGEKVEAALTEEEWGDEQAGDRSESGVVFIADWAHLSGRVCISGGGTFYAVQRPHAAAALCLHEQAFGFTWDDVDALRRAAEYEESQWGTRQFEGLGNLADRIAALLPPRERQQP